MLFKTINPHRFSYQPRYYQPPEENPEQHRVKFRSIGFYDRHAESRIPVKLLILLLAAVAVMYWLTGHKQGVKDVKITIEDTRTR